MLDFIVNIYINALDFIVLYCLCHNLIRKKIKVSYLDIIVGIAHTLFMATIDYFFVAYTYKIIVTVLAFLIIRYITKKKIHDLLVIYIISFLCVSVIQMIVIVILYTLTLTEIQWFMLVQTITSVIVLLLNWRAPLYKLLDFIEKELLLKLLVFILPCILLVGAGYFDFSYYDDAKPYIAYCCILFLISSLGIYRTLRYVFYYTNKVPVQLHDVKNILLGLSMSIKSTSDINKIRDEVDSALSLIGIDSYTDNTNTDSYNENILSFINQKKAMCNRKIHFKTDIRYIEDNETFSLSIILYMLGVLLDNAIESGTVKDILIVISVAKENIFISVSNEYERRSSNDFEKMFQQGFSTKSKQARGYGLSHLSDFVKQKGGDIQLKYEYNERYQCNYLTLKIVS